jgi:hypothetical protein
MEALVRPGSLLQFFVDFPLRVEDRVFLGIGNAGPSSLDVYMHHPSPSGRAGCLDDTKFNVPVLHPTTLTPSVPTRPLLIPWAGWGRGRPRPLGGAETVTGAACRQP